MKSSDLFIAGLRLLGAWQLVHAATYLGSAIFTKVSHQGYEPPSSSVRLLEYLVMAAIYGVFALMFMRHAPWLLSWCEGTRDEAPMDTTIPAAGGGAR